jgi:hypothetical protein
LLLWQYFACTALDSAILWCYQALCFLAKALMRPMREACKIRKDRNSMHSSADQAKKTAAIQIAPIDLEKASEQLQQRVAVIHEELRRLEEAKVVSQETMQLEVSV